MTNINVFGSNLSGATGTGTIVGSDSPVLTGTIDCSGALTFEIPNSAAPTTSSAGQIAIDTTITSMTPLPQFNDGSNTLYAFSIPAADLSTTDGKILTYNSGSSKFTLSTPLTQNTKIIKAAYATSSATDTTTSSSQVNTSLTINYTPAGGSNTLWIIAGGFAKNERTAASPATRIFKFDINRSTGTPAVIATANCGRVVNNSPGTNAVPQYECVNVSGTEISNDTSTHTYTLRMATNNTNTTTTFDGSTVPAFIMVIEFV
jgi:hypothetical protein